MRRNNILLLIFFIAGFVQVSLAQNPTEKKYPEKHLCYLNHISNREKLIMGILYNCRSGINHCLRNRPQIMLCRIKFPVLNKNSFICQ